MEGISIDNIKSNRDHALKQASEMSKHHPTGMAWVVRQDCCDFPKCECELAGNGKYECKYNSYFIIEGDSLVVNTGETLIAIFQGGTRKMIAI